MSGNNFLGIGRARVDTAVIPGEVRTRVIMARKCSSAMERFGLKESPGCLPKRFQVLWKMFDV